MRLLIRRRRACKRRPAKLFQQSLNRGAARGAGDQHGGPILRPPEASAVEN